MKKKIVCLALALVMVFSTMSITAEAATTITEAEVIARLSSAESKWADGTTYVKDKNNPCGSCFGFARELFSYVFGASLPTRWSLSTARFSPSNKNITEIAHVGQGYTLNDLKALFSKAKPGDVLVMSRGNTNHTVIIRSVANNGEGIYGYDANSDYKNTIRTNMYRSASSTRKSRPAGVTLYRYVNYIDTEMITVTYDANSGYVDQTTQIIEKGSCPRNMPIPVKDGYTFLGWTMEKVNPDFTGTYITTHVLENGGWEFNEDVTLYADWIKEPEQEKTFKVTLDDGSICRLITVTNGGTYDNLYTPSKDGYTFDGWYTKDGLRITSDRTVNLTGDQTLYAHWSVSPGGSDTSNEPNKILTPWSDWSTTPVYATSTREVETRQVEISPERTEYRYGRYVYTDYRLHTCWCQTYMTKLFGGATLQYSDWSTTRYSPTGKGWSCGNCNGNHIGVDHYTNGKAWWAEYSLPDGDYFWEESRTVSAQTQTEYRYRDWIIG